MRSQRGVHRRAWSLSCELVWGATIIMSRDILVSFGVICNTYISSWSRSFFTKHGNSSNESALLRWTASRSVMTMMIVGAAAVLQLRQLSSGNFCVRPKTTTTTKSHGKTASASSVIVIWLRSESKLRLQQPWKTFHSPSIIFFSYFWCGLKCRQAFGWRFYTPTICTHVSTKYPKKEEIATPSLPATAG